jgi:hypothetical protein
MMKDVAGDNTSKTTFGQARRGEVVRSDAAHGEGHHLGEIEHQCRGKLPSQPSTGFVGLR